MSELSKTRAFLQGSWLAEEAEFQGCREQDLAEIDALIHPHILPAAFREFYRCAGRGAGKDFEYDFRFKYFELPGHNEHFAKDHPNWSSGPFNEVFVFASHADGYCFYYLKDAAGDAQVPVHSTFEDKIYHSSPNLDTFIVEYLKQFFE